MRLHLSALKVHLVHCTMSPGIGRSIGMTFTRTGVPVLVAVPQRY